MILQALVNYYEALEARGEISAPGWGMEKVSFSLHLSPSGELLRVIPQLLEETRGKKTFEVPEQLEVPERVIRSSGVKANFLCDNTAYLLGFDNKDKPQRAKECFLAAKALHELVLEDCQGEAATAVREFFQRWDPDTARAHPALTPYLEGMSTANLVFRVEGLKFAQEDREVRSAWERHLQKDGGKEKHRCLVTGNIEPTALLHGKIRGIPGAQSAGANLISYNAPAYHSYGRDGDEAPDALIGEYAAFAYVTAINHLLKKRECRCQIGDTTVVYWAEAADPLLPRVFSFFTSPEPDTEHLLTGIMELLSKGRPVADVDLNKCFYVLGLAPNAARISVRFFLQDHFGTMLSHLQRHYERLEIQKPAFDARTYLSLYALLAETVNPNSRDKASSPLLSGAVMRSILTGSPYPQSLYSAVLSRIGGDKNVTRGRAAILKAYLIHNYHENEVTTLALNKTSTNRAYVLGRLFAVLENADEQKNDAIDGKSSLKERYLTSACSTPRLVFPQLLKQSIFHTAKSKYGPIREMEKSQLLNMLDVEHNPLPAHHSLEDQGIFMLGYYHQVQARYTKKEENKDGSN